MSAAVMLATRWSLALALPAGVSVILAVPAPVAAAAARHAPARHAPARHGRATAALPVTGAAPAATVSFHVTSTADAHDASPGDGRCVDHAARCTLRAAVEEAAAQPAGAAVAIGVPAGTYLLSLGSLDLSGGPVTMAGAGAGVTVIRATGLFRVLGVGHGATASLTGLTITGGAAGAAGYGGGVLSYATIAGNSSGLNLPCSNLEVTGTILASSAPGANCLGMAPQEPAGYNLDSGTSCRLAKPTDVTGGQPRLGPLADNGGATRTRAPAPGSAAIGHGGTRATGCPATDQRGLPRLPGRACDIGSVQVRPG